MHITRFLSLESQYVYAPRHLHEMKPKQTNKIKITIFSRPRGFYVYEISLIAATEYIATLTILNS